MERGSGYIKFGDKDPVDEAVLKVFRAQREGIRRKREHKKPTGDQRQGDPGYRTLEIPDPVVDRNQGHSGRGSFRSPQEQERPNSSKHFPNSRGNTSSNESEIQGRALGLAKQPQSNNPHTHRTKTRGPVRGFAGREMYPQRLPGAPGPRSRA